MILGLAVHLLRGQEVKVVIKLYNLVMPFKIMRGLITLKFFPTGLKVRTNIVKYSKTGEKGAQPQFSNM